MLLELMIFTSKERGSEEKLLNYFNIKVEGNTDKMSLS